MGSGMIRRGLRRALRAGLLQSYGGEHPMVSYRKNLEPPHATYRCPRCRGVKKLRRAMRCFGHPGHPHSADPRQMEIVDDSGQTDTPRLDVR